jgi:hypothetical protein
MPSSVAATSMQDHGIGSDRARNVFEVLLSQIREFNADLALDMIVRRRRDTNTTGFCDALKARCNVSAVANNVMWLDNYVGLVVASDNQDVLVQFAEL